MGQGSDSLQCQEDMDEEALGKIIAEMRKRYNAATNAATGATIPCPNCGKLFVKALYNKVFCSNQHSKGRTKLNNCKDRYWNVTDDSRRSRAALYNR
jgi:deoxycytidylate deaminase